MLLKAWNLNPWSWRKKHTLELPETLWYEIDAYLEWFMLQRKQSQSIKPFLLPNFSQSDGGVIKEIIRAGSGWEKPENGDDVTGKYRVECNSCCTPQIYSAVAVGQLF